MDNLDHQTGAHPIMPTAFGLLLLMLCAAIIGSLFVLLVLHLFFGSLSWWIFALVFSVEACTSIVLAGAILGDERPAESEGR